MSDYYKLDKDNNVIPFEHQWPDGSVPDGEERERLLGLWSNELAENHEIAKRYVAKTDLGWCWISTVFLGLDHRYGGNGPPIVFESMAFGINGESDLECKRYSTWNEAIAGHEAMVSICKRYPLLSKLRILLNAPYNRTKQRIRRTRWWHARLMKGLRLATLRMQKARLDREDGYNQ